MKKKILIFAVLLVLIIIFVFMSLIVSSSKNNNFGQLKVTLEHPFYVEGKWIKAEDLKIGDELTTADGRIAVVKSMQKIEVPESITVYNLEDELYHNYVVDNIIVHNSEWPGPLSLGAAHDPTSTNFERSDRNLFIRLGCTRIPISKTTLNLEITSRCNTKCITCPRDFGPKANMQLEDFKLFLERLAEDTENKNLITIVNLAGRGEPTIHPDFEEIMKLIKEFKAANLNAPQFGLVTNGQALTTEKIEAMKGAIDKLKFSCGSVIHFNDIHGLKWDVVSKNIRNAYKMLKDEGVEFSVHITPTGYMKQLVETPTGTITDLEYTTREIRNLFDGNVKIVLFRYTSNRAGNVEEPYLLLPDADWVNEISTKLGLEPLDDVFPTPNWRAVLGAVFKQTCLNQRVCLSVGNDLDVFHCINDGWSVDAQLRPKPNLRDVAIKEALDYNYAHYPLKELCDNCNIPSGLTPTDIVSALRRRTIGYFKRFFHPVTGGAEVEVPE